MLSIPHLIVIFIVALVVFGPEKIPELARNLGKVMAEFRRVTGDLRTTFEGHLRDLEREADTRRIAPPAAPVAPPVSAAPVAAPVADSHSVPPSPGTVPSNPPNAAAIAAPLADIQSPGMTNASPDPPDPMHDPYLMMDIPSENFRSEAEPSESEHKTERVTDGDGRAS
ncbi:MAG: twin-arginine translocase TatA/TatE family subunit [Candidatus Acidoferrales bacterium]|nr:twin-arginine translocase TatA/TatE family subunit [Candidatus Acidoferrales bacterium]